MPHSCATLRHDCQPGSSGTFLLLHGLAAAAGVWAPVVEALTARTGRAWLAVDLPGHGGSDWLEPAGYGSWASAVARTVATCGSVGKGPLTVVGHSLGGALALLLASNLFGVEVTRCVTIGTKVSWAPEELASAAKVAAGAPKQFPRRHEALGFWRRVAGVPDQTPLPTSLVEQVVTPTGHGRWRLRYDQRAAGLAKAPIYRLQALAAVETVAVRGEYDPVLGAADLRAVAPSGVTLAGSAHSPHLESVDTLAELLTGELE